MSTERAVRLLAGSLVLLGLAVFWLWTPYGLLLSAFVGLNLVQSSFTGFCPAERVLGRLLRHPEAQAPADCCSGALKQSGAAR